MARRRKTRRNEVSLFPFLDILACVIGNLILIITTVVLEQMDTKPIAEAARVDDVRERAAAEAARAARLERQLADLRGRAGDAAKQSAAVRNRIAAAEAKARESQARLAAATTAAPAPAAPRDTRPQLETETKQLSAEAKKLQAEIAERQKPPQQMIAILPSGSQSGPKRGVFVEVTKDKLVIYEPGKSWQVPASKIGSDPQFKKLLESTKADKSAIVTFLVRADGLSTLTTAQRTAQAVGGRTGRVPLPGSGSLDLSNAR
jgi:hypothetical protein